MGVKFVQIRLFNTSLNEVRDCLNNCEKGKNHRFTIRNTTIISYTIYDLIITFDMIKEKLNSQFRFYNRNANSLIYFKFIPRGARGVLLLYTLFEIKKYKRGLFVVHFTPCLSKKSCMLYTEKNYSINRAFAPKKNC